MIQAYSNSIYKSESQQIAEGSDVFDILGDLMAGQNKLRHPFISAKNIGLNLSIFLIDLNFARQPKNFKAVMINPSLVSTKAPLVSLLEDDLSIPGLAISIERPKEIEVSYFDENWKFQTKVFTDLSARWIMHGIDQLNGVSMIDKLNKHRQRSVRMQLKRISERKVEPKYKLEYEN